MDETEHVLGRAPAEATGARDAAPEGSGQDAGAEAAQLPAEPMHVGPAIRRLREQAAWSIQKLARESGVSAAAIHKIEHQRMVPSITVLLKLARDMGRSVAELLGDRPSGEFAVIRSHQRQALRFAELPIALERITAELPARQLEIGIYVVEPGAVSTPAPLSHAGEEIYYVLDGRIRFEVDGIEALLEVGDALHLKGSVPHRWQNAAEGTSRLFFALTPPPFTRTR